MGFRKIGSVGIKGPIEELTDRLRVESISSSNGPFPTVDVTLANPDYVEDGPLREVRFTVVGFPSISTTDEYEVTIRKVTK